jgi:hypothetical protein
MARFQRDKYDSDWRVFLLIYEAIRQSVTILLMVWMQFVLAILYLYATAVIFHLGGVLSL